MGRFQGLYNFCTLCREWAEFERFPENDKSKSKKYAIAKFENEMSPDDLEDNLSLFEKLKRDLAVL